VIFIKKSDNSTYKRINDWNDHFSIQNPSFGHIHPTSNPCILICFTIGYILHLNKCSC
jgi:hypothetical protein